MFEREQETESMPRAAAYDVIEGPQDTRAPVADTSEQEARECFNQLAAVISSLADRVDAAFGRALELLSTIEGHVVVTGIGKSGLIGQKIAATLASTGTPSFFVHAADAVHGDLGMITKGDAVLLISYSGSTEEVVRLLPHLRSRGVPTIALVGRQQSCLAEGVAVALDVSVDREVCPHNLAPTSSSLAALAMGDALAVSLMRMRGFVAEDFARLHPGGALGRRLLGQVGDEMTQDLEPIVQETDSVAECVLALARARYGIVLVVSGEQLCGSVSEAELREALLHGEAPLMLRVSQIMNRQPTVVAVDADLEQAEQRMRDQGLDALVVIDSAGRIVGLLPTAQGE